MKLDMSRNFIFHNTIVGIITLSGRKMKIEKAKMLKVDPQWGFLNVTSYSNNPQNPESLPAP